MTAIMVLAAVFANSAQAQIHYRGFVEGGLGFNYHVDSSHSNFAYELSTSHGIQLRKSFIGLGVGLVNLAEEGMYYSSGNYNSYCENKTLCSIFGHYRYDFYSQKNSIPYLFWKGGVIFIYEDEVRPNFEIGGGLRIRLSPITGLSFGLGACFKGFGNVTWSNESYFNIGILATVGFDF